MCTPPGYQGKNDQPIVNHDLTTGPQKMTTTKQEQLLPSTDSVNVEKLSMESLRGAIFTTKYSRGLQTFTASDILRSLPIHSGATTESTTEGLREHADALGITENEKWWTTEQPR